jgi:hypothetical protein
MSDHTPDNTYRIGEVAELLDLKNPCVALLGN